MHGKPNFKPTASPTSYTGSKPTDSQIKKKKKNPIQITEIRNLKSVVQYIRNH